jgi:hypothetical protein
MSTVVDYAWGRPGAEALKRVGASGVARYLSWVPNGKVINATEYSELKNAGLDIVLVWEFSATDFKNYSFNALEAAQEALRQANALGYDGALYYAIDWDITAKEWPTVLERLKQGPNLVHGASRTGIYGPWYALEWARRDGVASWFWQAGMSTAWSNGNNAYAWPGAHLQQYSNAIINGIDCDMNAIKQSNYGQAGGSTMQLTGPDPWGNGNGNEQAAELRNGYHILANGYSPTEANDNGVIARLERIEKAQTAAIDYTQLAKALLAEVLAAGVANKVE